MPNNNTSPSTKKNDVHGTDLFGLGSVPQTGQLDNETTQGLITQITQSLKEILKQIETCCHAHTSSRQDQTASIKLSASSLANLRFSAGKPRSTTKNQKPVQHPAGHPMDKAALIKMIRERKKSSEDLATAPIKLALDATKRLSQSQKKLIQATIDLIRDKLDQFNLGGPNPLVRFHDCLEEIRTVIDQDYPLNPAPFAKLLNELNVQVDQLQELSPFDESSLSESPPPTP